MMRTRRQFIKEIAAGSAALALAACTPGTTGTSPSASAAARPKSGGTLTVGNGFDVGGLDPTTGSGAVNEYFHQHMIDRLLYAGRDLKLRPGLAERWETAPDQKSVTLFLRKGVTFQDGTALDAEAVRWTFERNMTHPRTVHTRALAPVANVQVVDPTTVRINLKQPSSPFVAQLTTTLGAIMSRAEVEKQGDNFGKGPHKAGSGPFVMQELVSNDHVTYTKNPNWWGRDEFGGQLPYVDRLVIRIVPDSTGRFTNVRTGNVDAIYEVAAEDLQLAASEPSLVVAMVPSTSWQELTLNHRAGRPFNDVRYVKAVANALDRDEIVRVAYKGTASVGFSPISPLHFAYDPNFKPYPKPNLDTARALVSQVGKGPLTFELEYEGGDTGILQDVQLMQAQLKKADITMTLKALPRAQWTSNYTGGLFVDASLAANSGGGNVDPDVRFYDFRHSKGRSNYGKYVNAEVDRLLDQNRAISDQAQRTDLLRKAQQISEADDQCGIVIHWHNSYAVFVKQVKGWEPHPVTRPTFENAWVDR
jgi:peptide/nickel transport system substrate-binding protein